MLALLLLVLPSAATADERLWTLLKGGGQVVLIRHGLTTPGVGDPPAFRLDDCGTQRNLVDEGRARCAAGGRGVPRPQHPGRPVLSSPWCRCLETARLAFGGSEPGRRSATCSGAPSAATEQVRQMRALVGETPAGGNLVLVHAWLHHRRPDRHQSRRGGDGRPHAPGRGRFAVAGRLRAR